MIDKPAEQSSAPVIENPHALSAPAPDSVSVTPPPADSSSATAPAVDPVSASPADLPEAEPAPAVAPSAAVEIAPPASEPEVENSDEDDDSADTEAAATTSADSEASPSAPAEPALSSDGLTRLIATAYIGIGNKLFIRGDGPGLSLTKGTPLQFVSIGKWRWENPELLFPARVRLYKNDQIECTALGEFTLEPGHHHEVNATF